MRKFIKKEKATVILSTVISAILIISVFSLCSTTVNAAEPNPYLGTVWITDYIQLVSGGQKYSINDEIDCGTGPFTITKESIYVVFDSTELKYTVYSSGIPGLSSELDGYSSEYTVINGQMNDLSELLFSEGDRLGLDFDCTWRLKKENATPPSPAPSPAPGHNHEFVTEIVSEPNEMSDGEEVVRCKICGYELARNPISAYGYALNSYAPRMLNAAKTGDNVTLDFKEWNSFPKSFMEQIKAKVDAGVTVTFKYKYNHVSYEITIPANSKVDTSLDWYGPMCMYQIYVLGVPVAQ